MNNISLDARQRIIQGAINSNKIQHEKCLKKYNENPKFCKYCGKKLSYQKRRNKFCNHSCSASFNNLGVSRNKNDKILKVKKDKLKKMRKLQHTCLNCGIEFEDEKNENRKFCSISCSSLFKKRENIRKWINNLFEPKSSSIRKYYLEYRNESLKCDVCNNIE